MNAEYEERTSERYEVYVERKVKWYEQRVANGEPIDKVKAEQKLWWNNFMTFLSQLKEEGDIV